MNKTFIKKYEGSDRFLDLPDNSYWLSREEAILTYLKQRGASVPQVNFKDLRNKTLNLDNVGLNFCDLYLKNKNPNENCFLINLSQAIDALIEIFKLGVLHLDISARNITADSSNKIFILDFTHALTVSNHVQKPIPLLPIKKIHHPLLLKALKNDWEKYFEAIGKETPDLDSNFKLSNKDFSKFWDDNLEIQNLCKNWAILSHGISNLINELSNIKDLSKETKELLLSISLSIQNLKENEAERKLNDGLRKLKNSLEFKELDATKIPKISELEDSAVAAKKKFRDFDYLYPRITAWTALILSYAWIDIIASSTKLIFTIFVMLFTVGISMIFILFLIGIFFIKKEKILFYEKFLLAFIIFNQILMIASYPKFNLTQIWPWLINLLLIGIALFSIKKYKN
jgi:tRNA A-37 threonylcarbamoyl transferase component Bud32